MSRRRQSLIRRWTADDDGLLLQLHGEGKATRLIGMRLRRTRAGVSRRLHTLRTAAAANNGDDCPQRDGDLLDPNIT